MSPITYHLSPITFHLSPFTYHLYTEVMKGNHFVTAASVLLPAVQSGQWSVNQTGDKAPFSKFAVLAFSDGGTEQIDSFTVPTGKRLIIDDVSFQSNALTPGNGCYVLRVMAVTGTTVHLQCF